VQCLDLAWTKLEVVGSKINRLCDRFSSQYANRHLTIMIEISNARRKLIKPNLQVSHANLLRCLWLLGFSASDFSLASAAASCSILVSPAPFPFPLTEVVVGSSFLASGSLEVLGPSSLTVSPLLLVRAARLS
jgi:hypothetical protein